MEVALSRQDDTVFYHESRESKGSVMRRSLQYCVEQHLEEPFDYDGSCVTAFRDFHYDVFHGCC